MPPIAFRRGPECRSKKTPDRSRPFFCVSWLLMLPAFVDRFETVAVWIEDARGVIAGIVVEILRGTGWSLSRRSSLSIADRSHMLGTEAHADEAGGNPTQDREPGEELDHKWRRERLRAA